MPALKLSLVADTLAGGPAFEGTVRIEDDGLIRVDHVDVDESKLSGLCESRRIAGSPRRRCSGCAPSGRRGCARTEGDEELRIAPSVTPVATTMCTLAPRSGRAAVSAAKVVRRAQGVELPMNRWGTS